MLRQGLLEKEDEDFYEIWGKYIGVGSEHVDQVVWLTGVFIRRHWWDVCRPSTRTWIKDNCTTGALVALTFLQIGWLPHLSGNSFQVYSLWQLVRRFVLGGRGPSQPLPLLITFTKTCTYTDSERRTIHNCFGHKPGELSNLWLVP